MANNYTLTSTLYPLTSEQHKRAEEIIEEVGKENAASCEGIKPGDEGYDDLESQVEFEYKSEGKGIWMYHEESANPDQMADVISRFQVEFKADKPFVFSYCCECSKPRLDEFGGGTFAIMPDGSQYHAGTQEDALEKAKQAQQYAKVVWTVGDVQALQSEWSDEQAKEWLENNQKYIQERLVELGWEVMESLMNL